MEEEIEELPDEIVTEILARLPVKSLIRFTCVCKHFLSIIRSPEFAAKQYATRSKLCQDDHGNDCQYLMTSSVVDASMDIISYETLESCTTFQFKPVNNCEPSRSDLSHGDIVSWSTYGPCNGLFCLNVCRINAVLLLWNPATREVFKTARLTEGRLYGHIGFGYDDVTDDYKIVSFGDPLCKLTVQLYSLRDNSWRHIDPGITFGEHISLTYVLPTSNGRMFSWIAFDFQSRMHFILSFDMVDEVFILTPVPKTAKGSPNFVRQDFNHLHLCLSFCEHNCARIARMSIWMLENYGPEGRWTRKQCLSLPESIKICPPIAFWKNEVLVFAGEGYILSCYNPITQDTKSLQVVAHQLFVYTESLVAIKNFVCPRSLEVEEVPLRTDLVIPEANKQFLDDFDDEEDEQLGDDYYRIPKKDHGYYVECQYLKNTPYCLRELNQPLGPKPCAF